MPALSRPKYPPPLYFDALVPNSASPNRVDNNRCLIPTSPSDNNCVFEDGGSPFDSSPSSSVPRVHDLFDHRNNNNNFSYSSVTYPSQIVYPPPRPCSPLLPSNGPAPVSSRPNGLTSKSPSPTEIHPSFPHPLSAPHSQEHFSSISFGSDMNKYSPLHSSDRYGHHHQYGSDRNSFPLLDQRRMSEPSIFGSSGSAHASAYPNPNAEPSTGRYQQMQFAFNPPPQSPQSPYSSLHRGTSTGSLRDLNHHQQSAWKNDDHMLHSLSSVGPLDEPLSATFSGGTPSPHSPTLGFRFPSSITDDAYGSSPPGTGTSTTSSNAHGAGNPGSGGGSGSSTNSKTYSFVSLPGNAVKKRPRRRYDEIERLYQCSWPDCTKAYGTLNHLNAHITMQRHGSKRNPNEFKELRKQWRKAKKDEEADRSHSGHDGHGLRRSSMRRDRILDADLHPYPHHRYISHHPYHTSHHSSHALSALSSSLSVPSLGPDGRYAAVPIEDVRYPPDDLDGMPRGHRAEDAFRRGSYPDLRAQARCHGSAPGSWYPGMAAAASRPSGSHYPLHGHSSSHLNLSTGLPANADISLNRLGPESTLLTPLRDYESTSLVVSSGLNMYGGYAGAVYSDDDARPDTGHGSLYDDARPHTGQGSIYDDRPSTGHGSVYDDRPSTGNGSLYSDERPGTGHRSLYDDGRPGTGHGSDRGEFRHP